MKDMILNKLNFKHGIIVLILLLLFYIIKQYIEEFDIENENENENDENDETIPKETPIIEVLENITAEDCQSRLDESTLFSNAKHEGTTCTLSTETDAKCPR